MAILQDFKFAVRSLARAKGLSATVILTLALGIGANASIFSVVRGVLLRPLVNREESRQPAVGKAHINFLFSSLSGGMSFGPGSCQEIYVLSKSFFLSRHSNHGPESHQYRFCGKE